MNDFLSRRNFLARLWQAGVSLVGLAGLWTTWDLLRPGESTGFGGKIKTIKADAVPETGVVEVPAARSYLVNVNGETKALYQKCTHLGCKVPFCESSGQFECPCHGSVFNRAGEYRSGPAPRGMDEFAVEVGEDGLIYVDTGEEITGPPPGAETINEPVTGPSCTAEGGH